MLEKIKTIIEKAISDKDIPGASFGLIEKNKIETYSFGTKNYIEKVEENQIYDVASLTKVIVTTTLIFKLIEKKQLSLESKLTNILGGITNEDVTIGDLLLHNSGLPPGIPNLAKYKTEVEVIEEAKRLINGSKKSGNIIYSDVGFILLGKVIEEVTNERLDKYAEKNIFSKLNMKNTSYKPKNIVKIAPTEYENKSSKKIIQGTVHDETARILNGVSGHAGLFSTSNDISKFIYSMLFDQRILNDSSKKIILEKVMMDNEKNEIIRTYGYQRKTTNNKIIKKGLFHTGFTGCNLIIDYNKKIGFVLLSNSIFPRREKNQIFKYREKIFDLIYK